MDGTSSGSRNTSKLTDSIVERALRPRAVRTSTTPIRDPLSLRKVDVRKHKFPDERDNDRWPGSFVVERDKLSVIKACPSFDIEAQTS